MKEWVTLTDHIRNLLKDGKRSNHADFEPLFNLYGREKITEIAKRLLKEEREQNVSEE